MLRWLLAGWALLAPGCGVTPVPEPPNLDPPDLDRIVLDMPMSALTVRVLGAAGAVPIGSRIWAIDLDGMFPPVEMDAAADGSFDVELLASMGDELRLQARTDRARSIPIDVVVPAGTAAPRPLAGCFALEPAAELDLGDVATGESASAAVALRNRCAGTARVAPRLRAGPGAFVVEPATPFDVAPGADAELIVRFAPAGSGPAEEVVLVEIDVDPTTDRRPVTVYGTGTR